MTELESLVSSALSEVIAAAPTTATIGGTAVTGLYNPGDRAGELGMGGLVQPQSGDFTYPASAVSAPSLLTVISVGGANRRVMSIQEDSGMVTLSLGDPEDVR